MTFFADLNERFSQADFIQVSLLFFTILFFAFLITWPSNSHVETNSFFAISQLRLMGNILIALSFASVFSLQSMHKRRVTAFAVLALCIFTIPFEVAPYAMSFPPLPLYWSILVTLIDTLAFMGIGFLLGHTLSFLRLRFLLPLAVPALLVACVALDILIQFAIFNPLSAITAQNWPHLILMSIIAILTLLYLAPRKESPQPQ